MKGIIKSQFFQLKNHRASILAFVGVALVQIITIFGNMGVGIRTGGEVTADIMALITPINFLPLFVIVGQICCGDFHDKTTNYELMSGHQRYEVYFGRVIPTLIVGSISTLLLIIVMPVGTTILSGWGNSLDIGDVMIRYSLIMVINVRVICEAIMFAFLLKNQYVIMGLGYGFLMAVVTMGLGTENTNDSFLLSITNLRRVTFIDYWLTYGLHSEGNLVYDSALPVGDVLGTIIASLIFGAICLALGYIFFRRDDLN